MSFRASTRCLVLAVATAGCDDLTGPGPPHTQDAVLFQSSDSERYSVFSIRPDGSERRQILSEIHEVRGVSWSPGKDLIAFTSPRGGDFDIWTMNTRGRGMVRLTSAPNPDEFPAWSPTGLLIAFTSWRDGGPEIYVMNGDGSQQARLTNNSVRDQFPCWNPDGTRLAFQSTRESPGGGSDIWIMSSDGSDPTRVTSFGAAGPPAYASHPAWSPDGDRIAFVGVSATEGPDVFVVDPDGQNLRNITNAAGSYSNVDWSPDGSRIAFVSSGDVWWMESDGSGRSNLTNTPTEHDGSPDW